MLYIATNRGFVSERDKPTARYLFTFEIDVAKAKKFENEEEGLEYMKKFAAYYAPKLVCDYEPAKGWTKNAA